MLISVLTLIIFTYKYFWYFQQEVLKDKTQWWDFTLGELLI